MTAPRHTDADLVRQHLHQITRYVDVGPGPDLLDAAHAYADRRDRRKTSALAVTVSTLLAAALFTVTTPSTHDRDQLPPPPALAPPRPSTAMPSCSANFPTGHPMPTAANPIDAVRNTGLVNPDDQVVVAQNQQITGSTLTSPQTVVEETKDRTAIARFLVTHLVNGTWQVTRVYVLATAPRCTANDRP